MVQSLHGFGQVRLLRAMLHPRTLNTHSTHLFPPELSSLPPVFDQLYSISAFRQYLYWSYSYKSLLIKKLLRTDSPFFDGFLWISLWR